jgi:hypothetical protein
LIASFEIILLASDLLMVYILFNLWIEKRGLTMKYFTKSGIYFLAVIFLFTIFGSACLAAELKEKGLQVTPSLSGGKIAGVKVTINAANGGPKVNVLQLNYPGSTVLITTASLTAKKGFYKIELLEADKPSLTLATQGGKTVKGNGRLSVLASGAVQYRVTAKKAKKVVLNLSFSPLVVQDESRVSRIYSEGKISPEGDGLKLGLTCGAGKNCRLQAWNMSRSKAYRNILFQINYKMMTREGSLEKSKSGGIEDVLLPDKTGEWPIDLVFGEPPKDVKVLLIKADAVDPAGITAPTGDQQNNRIIPLTPSSGKQKENNTTAKPAVPVTAVPSIPGLLTGRQILSPIVR